MGPVRAFGDIQQAWTLKYFDKITAAEQKPRDEDTTPAGSFDFDDLGPDGLLSPITRRIWLWALRPSWHFSGYSGPSQGSAASSSSRATPTSARCFRIGHLHGALWP